MTRPPTSRTALVDALAMRVADGADTDHATVHAAVHDGWDVWDIPHGGYLAALVTRALLLASAQPDVFTVTVHFLRKAEVGPMRVQATRVGGSRRFASWHAVGTQDGAVVLTALASLGDRTGIDGPAWSDRTPWDPDTARLSPPAGDPELAFPVPQVAERYRQQIDLATAQFAQDERADHAQLRSVLDTGEVDQLDAIVACDLTPPAVWNVLGRHGWVPTLELTAHVRARPARGPLSVEVATHHVQAGFIDEEALVRDADGTLVVQSRQLARWTAS